ncbi:Receptor-like serine/threonine-protein kinase [Apostasia shenzhenica]|uniref:Receptor-like serine/threonine-protein kinase n=1 Tax=Apostasia shenzhenica TaxID=1088818 RepID=A0A2I0ATB8_9ASPA|nr:Receptor-like serine/threonine-protein kinase [Apostasia shenzhenica]
MKCFNFTNSEKKEVSQFTKCSSMRSGSTASTDRDMNRSVSEVNSQTTSEISGDSIRRFQFSNFSQRANSLRVLSFTELKAATRNFSRSLMIGEGGFGSVYRGTLGMPDDPNSQLEIAVKRLGRRGLQAFDCLLIKHMVDCLHQASTICFLASCSQMNGFQILFVVNFKMLGHKEWLTEVNVLGVVEHPNLVKLIGYCAEDDERGAQRLLVYEYMPNRSVEDHLSARSRTPLSWPLRLRIALDAARGLAYLHEGMDFQKIELKALVLRAALPKGFNESLFAFICVNIAYRLLTLDYINQCTDCFNVHETSSAIIIFRDFKTSNILLDENWNAKLSDFGLAREGPEEGLTHVSTAIVGTLGYAAPEYMRTGRLTVKSDIWSFGVVLYELITGRSAIDRNRPKGEQRLLEWVKPFISDIKKFRMIIDPRLDTHSSLKSAMRLSTIANRCLVREAKSRPRMSEVLRMLQRIIENEDIGAPKPPPSANSQEEATARGSRKKGLALKRRFGELKMGEGRRLVWRGWAPKIIKV